MKDWGLARLDILANLCVWSMHMREQGCVPCVQAQSTLGVLLDCSPVHFLRDSFWTWNCWSPILWSLFLAGLGLQACIAIPSCFCGCWESNSDSLRPSQALVLVWQALTCWAISLVLDWQLWSGVQTCTGHYQTPPNRITGSIKQSLTSDPATPSNTTVTAQGAAGWDLSTSTYITFSLLDQQDFTFLAFCFGGYNLVLYF